MVKTSKPKPKRDKPGLRRIGKVLRLPENTSEAQMQPPENMSSEKGSKIARIKYYQKLKLEKGMRKLARREKRQKDREEMGEAAVPKEIPKTLDNMRAPDDTFVSDDDEEVEADEADDEYLEYVTGVEPRLLITTCPDPCKRTREFCQELLFLFPNSEYFKRRGYRIKQITQYAVNKGYTDIMVIGDGGGGSNKKPCMCLSFSSFLF